jgi:hypothetical protein
MIPTSSVNLDGREDVLKFISSIILFRRRNNTEAKEAKRRHRAKVCEARPSQMSLAFSVVCASRVLWLRRISHVTSNIRLSFHGDAHGRARGLTAFSWRRTQQSTLTHCILSLSFTLTLSRTHSLSFLPPQAMKLAKPQKHRARKSERDGTSGEFIPNNPGYVATPDSNYKQEYDAYVLKKEAKKSMQDMIAQELAEMQGGEGGEEY